jgi:spermidine synthase
LEKETANELKGTVEETHGVLPTARWQASSAKAGTRQNGLRQRCFAACPRPQSARHSTATDVIQPFILLLFFCSGATALVYEVVWSKYLAQMLGSTVQAQTVVLASFMGGLALGNRIFGARADRAAQPLAMYGYIEMAIGGYAFFFPQIYAAADWLFMTIGTPVREQETVLLVVKGGLSAALLLGPTILMGGTLPLVAAWLNRSLDDPGRRAARFYSINSLGAVTGSGVAGFYLVEQWGMVSSLQLTAMFNLLIGLVAVGFARQSAPVQPLTRRAGSKETSVTTPSNLQGADPAETPLTPALSPRSAKGEGEELASQPMLEAQVPSADAARLMRLGCVVVAITGGVSMALEVLAARSLILIFGGSLQAFAIVLMAFILGIGLGASVMASPRWRGLSGVSLSIALLLAAAGCVAVLVIGIEQWVEWYIVAKSGIAKSEIGYRYHQLLAAGLSLVVLGVPAGLLGAVLPLWMRTVAGGTAALGAVAGVMVAGFALMPLAGLRGAFLFLVAGLGVAAALMAQAHGKKRALGVCVGLTLMWLAIGAVTGGGWRHVLSSGAFRMHSNEPDLEALKLRKQFATLLFYEDGPDATVSVERSETGASKGEIGLRVNGKPDASSRGDLSTQLLLAHVPMAARPESSEVFVLGLGSGITAGALLAYPQVEMVVAENAAPVIRAARYFDEFNRGVVTNSRARIRKEDARTLLKLDPRAYDVIISEPSNPWMAGVGSVFSREFYELCARRLKPGGVMVQWFHIYEMNDGIVALVLRTFGSVFPHLELWDVGGGDIILLGSQQPWTSDTKVYSRIFAHADVRADLERIGIKSPEAFWSRQLASQRTAHAIAGPGPMQSDLFPVLEYAAPMVFFLDASSTLLQEYDERTWQLALAAPDKRRALAALDTETLRAVFRPHNTINRQLRPLLRARLDGENPVPRDAHLPSLLRAPEWPPYAVEIRNDTPADLRKLVEAENQLRAGADNWRTAATVVEQLLQAREMAGNTGTANWSAGHFAWVAASTALSQGDRATAVRLLELGLAIDTAHAPCQYLARVLER